MDNLIICNQRRVSDFLGLHIKEREISKNEKCKEFINTYQEYFNDVSPSSFKEFYSKTGLNLAIIYEEDVFNKMSFNELGSKADKIFKNNIYNHDLLVINKANSIKKDDKIINIDNKIKYVIGSNTDKLLNENQYRKIRYKLSTATLINDQKKIIQDMYENKYQFKEDVKQIYLSSFGNLFVLYNDGTLYKENEIYAKNVSTIWEANSYVCFLIFKDYSFEYLSNSCEYYHNEKCDKIIYNDNYIAFLRNKEVEIISILEESDLNFHAYFSNVDDVDEDTYELKKFNISWEKPNILEKDIENYLKMMNNIIRKRSERMLKKLKNIKSI